MGKLRILMLGPTLAQRGGMATVENLIISQSNTDIEIRHIATHDEGSVLHRLQIFFWALVQFLWCLLQGQVDVIHLHVSERGCVARNMILAEIGQLFRKPVIMHTHGCEFDVFYEKLPLFGQRLVSWVFQRCTYLIALSENWKKYYISRCGLTAEQVLVLHNPIEFPVTIPSRKTAPVVRFASLGRVGQRKGTFDLLQAFANLPENLKAKAELVLAGDGAIAEALSLVNELGLEKQVKVVGWIDVAQCQQLLAVSDVFILPSYHEGLPVAMLEAMSWGLPAIVSPVGGITDVAKHQMNALLVEPGNIQQITTAIQSLIQDAALRLELGQRARHQVAPLDIRHYYAALQIVYRSAQTGQEYRLPEITVQSSNL